MTQNLTYQRQCELYEYLCKFITEKRRKRFEEVISLRTRHITVILEDIYQSHNASAVLRTCDCFGIQDVHIIENRNPYKINPDIALGSTNWLSLHNYQEKENNSFDCLQNLKNKGYSIVATNPHKNDCLLEELDITHKTAIMFGTEKDGLSEIAIQQADAYVKIPMCGFTESFNISVSAAITMYSINEKLRKSDILWQLTQDEKIELLINWATNTISEGEKVVKQFLNAS